MRLVWPPAAGGYWLTPAVLGALLILIGVMIYAQPRLLAYFVAGVFIVAGVTLLSVAWKMRQKVTYRRIDENWADKDL
jgi:uncharacterized membrane protein HdeD (DUF308 family)